MVQDDDPLPLVLASASPRRASLLSSAGFNFVVRSADVDERPLPGEDGVQQALRLARAKADAVAKSMDSAAVVIGSDTLVLLDGRALGKPQDLDEALHMLEALNGREHEVVTAVAVLNNKRAEQFGGAVSTKVAFCQWEPGVLRAYAATGEGLDKAGAYAIQDGGGALISHIEGSASNVIGLPLAETIGWIAAAGGPPPFGANEQ